ncbi:MAG TPA: invasin domain 3-containing protein, partial [Thermoanaerobaculia bacterium]|nr:invasin domain 3-containing protein [Thermoanaerobaculia bacterium]
SRSLRCARDDDAKVIARSAATKRSRCPAGAVVLLLAALGALACNSGGGGGGSPTDPGGNIALALTATPATIALNGHAQIVAQVTATGGAARGGLRVVLATNLGTLDSTQLTTDANGRAETTLRAGTNNGTARITGTLEGRSTAATEVRIGLDRVVTLQIEPSTITGNETATVTVFAFEGDSAPVPPGTDVELTTDRGQLGAARLDTDVQGAAVTTLRTGGATGTAHVTARVAGGPTATAQATLLAAPPSGTTVRLTASPPSTPANGTTIITVLVADAAGAPLTGAEVELGTTIGRLDLTRLHTDTSGLATTTLRGDGRRGTATLSAHLAGTTVTVRITVRFT